MVDLGRYIRILGQFWQAAISAEMEYRLNFVLTAIGSLGNLAGGLFSLFLFYRGGMNLPDGIGIKLWWF